MAVARITTNTTKAYPCTMCGAPGNIVREDRVNPRLKCTQCRFMYDASDSTAAQEAGSIPDGPPKIEEPPGTITKGQDDNINSSDNSMSDSSSSNKVPRVDLYSNGLKIAKLKMEKNKSTIPRNPTHLFCTKDRKSFAFAGDSNFKKTLLKWESLGRAYDVFQLMKFEYSVDINVKN